MFSPPRLKVFYLAYHIVVDRQGYLDTMEVMVEVSEDSFTGNYRELEQLQLSIKEKLSSVLTITPRIKLVEPKTLERTSGKSKRVTDKRNMLS